MIVVVLQKWNGSFYNCLEKANKSAISLLNIIVDNFKSYQDVATYKGTQGKTKYIKFLF